MRLTTDELLKNYLQYVGKSVFVYMPEVIDRDESYPWLIIPDHKRKVVITEIRINTMGVAIRDNRSEEYILSMAEVYTTEDEVDARLSGEEGITLEECPIGLFKHHGVLVLKTEYVDDVGRCECYTVDGGERFWGDDAINLNQLIVQPVQLGGR